MSDDAPGIAESGNMEHPPIVDELPDEILLKVFSHLDFPKHYDALSRVSRRWYRLSRDPELWRHLETKNKTPTYVSHCLRLSDGRLSSLKLTGVFGIRRVIQLLGTWKCSCLTTLQLVLPRDYQSTTLEDLVALCPSIKYLTISGPPRTNFAALQNLRELRTLRLHKMLGRFDTKGVSEIVQKCEKLEVVELGGDGDSVSEAAFSDLIRWRGTQLRRLGIDCGSLSDRSFQLMKGCHSLKYLNLCWWNPGGTPSSVKAVGSLCGLYSLRLRYCCLRTAHDFSSLFVDGHFPHLRTLEFNHCTGLQDEILASAMMNCPKLQVLEIDQEGEIQLEILDALAKMCKGLLVLRVSMPGSETFVYEGRVRLDSSAHAIPRDRAVELCRRLNGSTAQRLNGASPSTSTANRTADPEQFCDLSNPNLAILFR